MSNLYDSSAQPIPAPETLPLDAIIQQFVTNGLRSLRVFLPASIVAVHGDQTIDAQPLWQVRYVGQPPSDMPVVPRVPVMMPQGATYRVSYPLAIGDTGGLLIGDRSFDTWLAGTGAIADPGDPRAHVLTDGVFIPGLVPTSLQTQDTGTDLVLGNGAMVMRLKKSGQLSLSNGQNELLAVMQSSIQTVITLIATIEAMQVLTAFGPAPLLQSSISALQSVSNQMQAVLARLQTLQVS